MVDMVQTGATDKDLVLAIPASIIRYKKGIDYTRLALAGDREWKTQVYFAYGGPGLGKSYWAKTTFPNAYWKMPNNSWWDGYVGQANVVFDDFSGKWLKLDSLLRIMDENPLMCEIKGSSVSFVAKNLAITSNFLPSEWYKQATADRPDRLQAIHRRIDKWILFVPSAPRVPIICSSFEEFQSLFNQHYVVAANPGFVTSPLNPNFRRARSNDNCE